MIFGEWNMEDCVRVRTREAREEGIEEGLEKGLEKTARNALARGLSLDVISDITGLDTKTITGLSRLE
jgi:predicted transposase YdaD